MHIRKVTLHVILLRVLALPMDLRAVIIEDFFPFLPKPRYCSRRFLAICDDGKIKCSWLQNLSLDCVHRVYPNYSINSQGTEITFRVLSYVDPTLPSRYCTNNCCNKQLYIRDCNAFIPPSDPYVVHIEELKNSISLSERKILHWYRNTILLLFVKD